MASERTSLSVKDAVALWDQGKKAWNAWVEKHPEADISFEGWNFSEHELVRFGGFRFPDGNISFRGARFGDGWVDFENATFGDGIVDFRAATFVDGWASFKYADFGDGDVFFGDARFGDGGFADFTRATFGEGNVDFGKHAGRRRRTSGDDETEEDVGAKKGAKFGKGGIRFFSTKFGKGNVLFRGVTFGGGDVDFFEAEFGDGKVDFSGTKFGSSNVSFRDTEFGDGAVDLSSVAFGDVKVSFANATFGGPFSFTPPPDKRDQPIRSLSFQNCRFDDRLVLAGSYSCIPDLRNTITTGHVDLQKLIVKPWKVSVLTSPVEAFSKDPDEDVPALRRLKELAESNRHHDAALRFFADERRALRWHKDHHMGAGASLLDWAYDTACDYGQSLVRPTFVLLVIILLFVPIYAEMPDTELTKEERYEEALSASVSNTVPFLPSAVNVRTESFKTLFGVAPPFLADALRLLQGAAGFVFLFLIGLGLRNRFRM